MKNKSFFFLNLGCPKNQTDGDYVRGALTSLGFAEAENPGDSDYIFVNTCAFIDLARRETKGEIEQLLPYMKNGTQLIALGCYPALSDIRNELPAVDASFRFDELDKLLEYMTGPQKRCFQLSPEHRIINDLPYAYVVISDGCDNRCSYCTIPLIRGPYRSRLPEDILREIEYLAARNIKEIVLVAQDTTLYGGDLDVKDDLPSLCRKLARVDGIEWIRLMYAHPAHLDERVIAELFAIPQVCRYLDLPLQHISDKILSLMGRRTDAAKIRRLIKHLRNLDENISLRTTLMVGFPGETDDDYKQLLEFVEEIRFDYLGAFAYSPEVDTAAYEMNDRVDEEIVQERLDLLYEIAGDISREKAEAQIGKSETLLIDGQSAHKEGYFEARSYRQAPEIDGVYMVPSDSEIKKGEFIRAKIAHADLAEAESKEKQAG